MTCFNYCAAFSEWESHVLFNHFSAETGIFRDNWIHTLGDISTVTPSVARSLKLTPRWGIYASKKRVSIGSYNGLSPIRRQAII